RAGQQRERERELAAGAAAGEQREPAARQAADAGESVDRCTAEPSLRWRQLGRPGQRMAAEAHPDRINGQFEFLSLHLSEPRRKTQGGDWRPKRKIPNECSEVKRLNRPRLSSLYVAGGGDRRRGH